MTSKTSFASSLLASAPYWVGVAAGLAFAGALGAFDERAARVHTTDFSGFWAGGRALVLGLDPYDPHRWVAVTGIMGTQPPDTLVYGYFPWVALAMAPLALFGLSPAAVLWMLFGIALAALGLFALIHARACPPVAQVLLGFALFACQPTVTAIMVGQWSLVLVGAIALSLVLLERRPTKLATIPLLFMLAKPQLFLLSAPALLLHRRDIAVRVIAVGALLVGTATAIMPTWLPEWLGHVPSVRIADPPSAAVIGPLLFDLSGTSGPLTALAIVIGVAALVILRFGVSSPLALGLWVAVSVLAAPYAWSYDWALLMVPLTVVVLELSGGGRRRSAVALAVFGALWLTLVASGFYALAVARGRETASALVPWTLTLVLLVAAWPLADREDRRRV